MNIPVIARSARLYLRTELIIAQIRFRTEARRVMLLGFAAVLCVLGIGLVNMALFAALESLWGPVWTPLALGLLDFALAGLALGVALMQKPGAELATAEDMRSVASSALEGEVESLFPRGGGLFGAMTGGADPSAARMLLPVITTIIGALRRRKEAPKP